MIEIGYSEALFIYFLLWMLLIGILWRREESRLKRYEWHLSNSQLFHCDNCHHSFVPERGISLCRCPRCNSICIRRRHGARPM